MRGFQLEGTNNSHTHTVPIHFTALSVSAIRRSNSSQTPASCLATTLHIHGNAIKSNNKEKRIWDDGGNFDSIRICLERSHVYPQFTFGFHQR